MSRYDLKELVRKWAREEMTAEQAIGQILQQLQELADKIQKLEIENRRPASQWLSSNA